MNLSITKDYYNKTIKNPIDNTFIVDTDNKYLYYNINLNKNYFDINTEEELLENIKIDLEKEILAIDEEINRLKEHSTTEELIKLKTTR